VQESPFAHTRQSVTPSADFSFVSNTVSVITMFHVLFTSIFTTSQLSFSIRRVGRLQMFPSPNKLMPRRPAPSTTPTPHSSRLDRPQTHAIDYLSHIRFTLHEIHVPTTHNPQLIHSSCFCCCCGCQSFVGCWLFAATTMARVEKLKTKTAKPTNPFLYCKKTAFPTCAGIWSRGMILA
jgi:hypothetical protein